MLQLIDNGVPNIVLVQPFACLPNHVTGKGMLAGIRRLYPQANIVAVDYDPGASEVNQLNRIKLMLSAASRPEKAKPAQRMWQAGRFARRKLVSKIQKSADHGSKAI
jgi:predicted nucleotide-binding protein (sugar kinase/HSP70/actin superfamily)